MKNISAQPKKQLAVVIVPKNFHPYLCVQMIHLRIDNAAVIWMRNLKKLSGQIAMWLEVLGTTTEESCIKVGKTSNTDALSRTSILPFCTSCKRQECLNFESQYSTQIDQPNTKLREYMESADKQLEHRESTLSKDTCRAWDELTCSDKNNLLSESI